MKCPERQAAIATGKESRRRAARLCLRSGLQPRTPQARPSTRRVGEQPPPQLCGAAAAAAAACRPPFRGGSLTSAVSGAVGGGWSPSSAYPLGGKKSLDIRPVRTSLSDSAAETVGSGLVLSSHIILGYSPARRSRTLRRSCRLSARGAAVDLSSRRPIQ